MENQPKSSMGPLIGTVIVFVLLITGGVYILQSKSGGGGAAVSTSGGNQPAGEPDSIDQIKTDFTVIDVTNMDAGLEKIDKDLQ